MKKDKVLVLGRGFLGKCFERHGYEVWGRDKLEWNGRNSSSDSIVNILSSHHEVIINTIGISDTRFCEEPLNWPLIHEINGILPGILSGQCHIADKKFVHISTGCLYDTRNVPQKEDSFKAAHCNYVVSKWIGEIGCDKKNDLILRPRLLFDSAKPTEGKRNNLICKLEGFEDFLSELNTVTSNDTIVEATQALLDAGANGVYNVGQTGEYTIADMARSLGFEVKRELTQEDLHASQGLFLVNNLMDLSKLREYYEPRDALIELKRCNKILKGSIKE